MLMRDSALHLSFWLNHGRSRPRYLIALVPTVIGGLIFLYLILAPQLIRFRFRAGLSWYDLGLYGFGPSQDFVSFDKESRFVEISPADAQCDPRFTFFAPRGDSVAHPGPMILDAQGDLVWMKHNAATTQDFKLQRYKGQDYLTYWEGDEEEGHGLGSWYMEFSCFPQLDSNYKQRFVISPVGTIDGDLHEFTVTCNDTALVSVYEPILYNLTSIGGPEIGWMYDSIVQEIDIATGELLFEWRASNFYPPESSFQPIENGGSERSLSYDFFHLNSADKDDQGRILISGRHTHTVTCVDSFTGDVLWTLGGKGNEFSDLSNGSATDFAWQHDARWQGSSSLTLFDNAANSPQKNADASKSRGLWIDLDIDARQARLVASYVHPQELLSFSQGNLQILDTGNVIVGWGHSGAFTEFSADGDLLCDVHFGASAYFSFGRVVSYRVYKGYWVGTPDTLPDAVISGNTVYVSWNGATEVDQWRLEACDGQDMRDMQCSLIEEVARSGFETEIAITAVSSKFFKVSAINSNGQTIGTTELLRRYPLHEKIAPYYWVAILFATGCLLYGIYYAAVRSWRHRDLNGIYRLVGHKEPVEVDFVNLGIMADE
ncbi:hypothetical protein N7495_006705 [Penicillium taxi]|uniref:uncharacterized protein n=1 Tax=Penicillium taxi TaxID=168475 RepID=UPI002545AFF4|nr:uncharacterized protein N7495_006705 [Penicillium taxi]KAJ5895014.1 hypothetical protein N7495_006705 [Penicillium taxi]